MFALIALLPLVYTVLGAYAGFPLREQRFNKSALQNDSLVIFLDLNLTGFQEFSFFVPNDQVKKQFQLLYVFIKQLLF